jgi:thioredoxin reductase (NADPH)
MRDFDLVVVGAGVAGLTAAMFAGRHGLSVVVLDRIGVGGQIINAETIENWPGFPQGIGGHELGPLLHEQAEAAGAELMLDTVEAIELSGEHRIVRGAGESLRARALIIAAGSSPRALGVPGESELRGSGVSQCAACDGALFAGREVGVVGGGDTALDEALVLAGHAARVVVFHRGERPEAQQALRDKIAACRNIELVPNTIVEGILGEAAVTGVRLRAASSGATRLHTIAGVFVCVGLAPNTEFLGGLLALDAEGRIATDASLQTSVAGIFAAGDIRAGSVAQLAAAAGDGATAAIAAVRYIERGR